VKSYLQRIDINDTVTRTAFGFQKIALIPFRGNWVIHMVNVENWLLKQLCVCVCVFVLKQKSVITALGSLSSQRMKKHASSNLKR